MGFVDELRWRGMLHDMTPGAEETLMSGPQIGYIGFDPTAASLTIGNYVQVMILNQLQQAGHTPIFLMGGATGRVGDPSGKDAERQLKSYEELDANLARQTEQVKKMLNFESGDNKALLLNNYDFYKEMNVLDYLRDIGKNLTVNYMLSKDSVKNRLEKGLSYTEFSYQLLQAYDFLYLYRNHGCRFQMGGSDQWGNITSGTEFIRRNIDDGKAYAVTTPLLTKSDGKKFGKSEKGNIWMDAELTSPYEFYQFWINAADDDLGKYLRYFSYKKQEEVIALEQENTENPRALKAILAEELVTRIHGQGNYERVLAVSNILFNKKASTDELKSLDSDSLGMIAKEITNYELPKSKLEQPLSELLTADASVFSSKGEMRRAVKNNAISINKVKIADPELKMSTDDLIKDGYVFLENGKKTKILMKFS